MRYSQQFSRHTRRQATIWGDGVPTPFLSCSLRPFLLCLLAAVTLLTTAFAATLLGHCVGVADGDTCTLRLSDDAGGKRTERFCFHGIDAPTRKPPGLRARCPHRPQRAPVG